jgi:hypothetical protein
MNNENDEKLQLRRTINFHETFNNFDECIDYITECKTEKIFFIIVEEFIDIVLPVIHDFVQIQSIYILSENNEINQQIEQYSKVCGIYPQIIDIHQVIIQNIMRLLPNDNLPVRILPSNNINRLDASFMYFQLFLDILLYIDVGNAKQDMIDECLRQYNGNEYDFIKDLYFQLEKSNENDQQEQSGTIIVYRGQLLISYWWIYW